MALIFADGMEIETSGPYRIIEENRRFIRRRQWPFVCGCHTCGGGKDDQRFVGDACDARGHLQGPLNPVPARPPNNVRGRGRCSRNRRSG